MSTENMIRDVEVAEEALQKKAKGPQVPGRSLYLILISFLLLAGAIILFCLLHFGLIGPQNEEESPDAFLDMKPLAQRFRSYQTESDRPVAHVIADPTKGEKLEWWNGLANDLLKSGMKLKNNQLVVPAPGLYLIYSQLLFKGNNCTSEPLILTHTISRVSLSYEHKVRILGLINSPCQKVVRGATAAYPWYEPTYLGGDFQLEIGDMLSADANYPEYLDLAEPGQAYFGIIAL